MDEVQEKEEGTKILKRFVGKTKATRLAKDKNDSILGYVSSVSFSFLPFLLLLFLNPFACLADIFFCS